MNKYPLPKFPEDVKSKCKNAVKLAAEWHSRVQIRHSWPAWTSDAGRFMSQHALTRKDKSYYSICWNTSRGAQACLSAYKLLKDPSMLDTAKRAMEYVKMCQIFSPEYPQHAGAFVEETPQTDHIASRDSVEALQGLVNTYVITKDPVYLQRAKAGADWWKNWFIKYGYPNGYIWHAKENDKGTVNNDFSRIMLGAVALVFCQLDTILGEKKYSPAAAPLIDWIIDNTLEADGALKLHDGTDVGHHAIQDGPYANCFTNDDGAMISIMAAYRVLGDKKYHEAVMRNSSWWLKVPVIEHPYASTPAILVNLVDFYRFTGNEAFLSKALDYAEKLFKLQITESDDPHALGGFRGHDHSSKKEIAFFDGIAEYDIVSHRTTMYAMMGLSKMAASTEDEWNMAYSAFGW
ncbi:MAG: hypothetical protein JNL74_17505 [Fibrobacteres bacterium]|nr:hypothetical protein [Fibrobacterota bacterium]